MSFQTCYLSSSLLKSSYLYLCSHLSFTKPNRRQVLKLLAAYFPSHGLWVLTLSTFRRKCIHNLYAFQDFTKGPR